MEFFDVGGRKLALTRGGRGTVSVILETGLGAESNEWQNVQAAIEPLARVVRYDRAFRGASDPATTLPRTARDMVDDLDHLIRVAEIPGPYILVGQSFGGLLVRLYAHLHRYSVDKTILGLVLVDSMLEGQFEFFANSFPPPSDDDPPALRTTRAFWKDGWRHAESTTERIDFPRSIEQGREITPLGNLPIRVLTAGTFLNQPLLPEIYREKFQRQWETMQESLLTLSTRSQQTFVRDSGHFIQRDRPDSIVEAVRSIASLQLQPTQ